jgi:DNA-binding transcriptional regulator YiaG
VQTIHYLLNQRQRIETLINEKQSVNFISFFFKSFNFSFLKISKQNEILSKNLHLEQDSHLHTQQLYNDLILNENQYRQKLLKLEKEYQEQNRDSQEEIHTLRKQLKVLQDQFERLTNEHLKTIEQIDQDKHEYQEREQRLLDETHRLKRDFGLELYRKQDAEKKARAFEDKLRHEQTQYQKIQYDFTKTKHDLKTLQVKYDALQLEMIEMQQKPKIKSPEVIAMLDARTSASTINEEQTVIEPQKRSIRAKRRTDDEVNNF